MLLDGESRRSWSEPEFELPFGPHWRMLRLRAQKESSMSKAGLDNRHRNKDGEISGKHGHTLLRTLR